MKRTYQLILALELGALIAFQAQSQTIGFPDEKAEFLTAIMTEEIPLKADQVESVYEINLEMIEGIDQARDNGEPYSVLREHSENRDELLSDLLDAQQYQVFEEKLALFRQKMNEKFSN